MPSLAQTDATLVAPIVVESDRFTVFLGDERAEWHGDVVATQGNYTFRTSRLTVFMDQVSGSRERNSTNAKHSTDAFNGYELSARQLHYDVEDGAIVGRGDSELRHGAEMIRAESIAYDVSRQEAMAFPNADGRVLVRFYGNPKKPVFPSVPVVATSAQAAD